jgi:hypothetical protein
MAVSTIQNASLASGVPSTAKMPAGSVIQFVSATSTTFFSSSSSSNVSTGISISITPTSASSKILVAFVGGDVDTQAAGRQVYLMIYRGGTNLGIGSNQANADYYFEGGRGISPMNIVVVDSPNTTSSVTYTLYARCFQGTFQINSQSIGNYIYAMEIAA